MAVYKSSEELEGKKLSYGDSIVFIIDKHTINYVVVSNHLKSKSFDNDKIFKLLFIEDKYKFAKYHYGYDVRDEIFPQCHYGDYEALTRITIALFKMCEEKNNEKLNKHVLTPIYRVGDKVLIKPIFEQKYSYSGISSQGLYRMSINYGSTIQEIEKIIPYENPNIEEPFIYRLKNVDYLTWYSFMFSDKIENPIKNNNIHQNIKSNKMEKKSIFTSFIDKYKAQFIPEKDDNLKISMDGNVCVPIDGEYVGIDKNDNLISYPEEACFNLPIYLLSKPFAQIQVGDIILVNKSYMKVLKKGANGNLNCLTFSGYTRNKKEVKDFVLGQSFAKVVVNMFGNIQAAGFNPMMFAMCDDGPNIKDMLIMQMIQNGGGAQMEQINPMLMMALMDKDGESSMFETMMMMQMMGGQFSNPFMLNNKK